MGQMADASESEAETTGSFDAFRRLVLEDPALQAQLWAVSDREAFVALTVALGQQRGCRFDDEAVKQAMQTGRRTWIERWLP